MGCSPLSWISAVVIDKECHQLLAAGLVDLVKAGDQRAVEVEHARHLPGFDQGHDQLGARCRVASDMAWKVVDVGDQNRSTTGSSGAANAVAERDPYAGRL